MTSSSDQTLSYYTRNAALVAARYENVDASELLATLRNHLKNADRILEIGCGSGRDAAALLSYGFDVIAIDGSYDMLEQARRYHPELSGLLKLHILPAALPFSPECFDVVVASAVLLHLGKEAIQTTLREIHRVLSPAGRLIYSVNTARPGLDESGLDTDGRQFTVMSRREWECINQDAGFRSVDVIESEDVTGRNGVNWISFVLAKPGDEN